jgi:hypothetical protein
MQVNNDAPPSAGAKDEVRDAGDAGDAGTPTRTGRKFRNALERKRPRPRRGPA